MTVEQAVIIFINNKKKKFMTLRKQSMLAFLIVLHDKAPVLDYSVKHKGSKIIITKI